MWRCRLFSNSRRRLQATEARSATVARHKATIRAEARTRCQSGTRHGAARAGGRLGPHGCGTVCGCRPGLSATATATASARLKGSRRENKYSPLAARGAARHPTLVRPQVKVHADVPDHAVRLWPRLAVAAEHAPLRVVLEGEEDRLPVPERGRGRECARGGGQVAVRGLLLVVAEPVRGEDARDERVERPAARQVAPPGRDVRDELLVLEPALCRAGAGCRPLRDDAPAVVVGGVRGWGGVRRGSKSKIGIGVGRRSRVCGTGDCPRRVLQVLQVR